MVLRRDNEDNVNNAQHEYDQNCLYETPCIMNISY
jgi:hypothetical protein